MQDALSVDALVLQLCKFSMALCLFVRLQIHSWPLNCGDRDDAVFQSTCLEKSCP